MTWRKDMPYHRPEACADNAIELSRFIADLAMKGIIPRFRALACLDRLAYRMEDERKSRASERISITYMRLQSR